MKFKYDITALMTMPVKDLKPELRMCFHELREPIASYGNLYKWIACTPGSGDIHIYILRVDPSTPGTCVMYSDIAKYNPEIYVGGV